MVEKKEKEIGDSPDIPSTIPPLLLMKKKSIQSSCTNSKKKIVKKRQKSMVMGHLVIINLVSRARIM